jgi:hypothetical protein
LPCAVGESMCKQAHAMDLEVVLALLLLCVQRCCIGMFLIFANGKIKKVNFYKIILLLPPNKNHHPFGGFYVAHNW